MPLSLYYGENPAKSGKFEQLLRGQQTNATFVVLNLEHLLVCHLWPFCFPKSSVSLSQADCNSNRVKMIFIVILLESIAPFVI